MKEDGYQYYQYMTIDALQDYIPFESIFKEQPLKAHKKLYTYNGPVMYFDNCISDSFTATTYAVSIKKAKSNILYQVKKKFGLQINTGGLKLVNSIREVDS